MANDTNKSSAEAYRERRKKQIARAAKKGAKKSAASDKAVKIIVSTVCILLAVCLVGYSAFSLSVNVFGSLQRVITVATVNNYKVSAAESNYYYSSLYNQIYTASKQYDQYGTGMGKAYTGYDTSISPDSQQYTGEDEFKELPENPTWADYFALNAPRRAYQINLLYEKALEAKMTLSDDDKKSIDDEISEMRTTAAKNNFSLNRYLSIVLGEGVNEKIYRELREKDILSTNYSTKLSEEYSDKISDEEIQKYYKENSKEYDSVFFRMFVFSYSAEESEDADTYTQAKAKSLADNMLAEVKDYSGFNKLAQKYAKNSEKEKYQYDDATAVKNLTYTYISTNINESLADWLFKDGRKVNDKTVLLDEKNTRYYVVCMEKTSSLVQELPVDVRHILVQFETTDEDGKTIELTDEIKKAAKDEIDAIYKEWQDGAKTEDSFAELAKSKSDDTGSKEKGGLYENVYIGQMVSQFENWCYDSSRKAGDTGIIETSYGYHLMYYVGRSEEPYWKIQIRTKLGNEDFTQYNEDMYKEAQEADDRSDNLYNYFSARHLDSIKRNYTSTNKTAS